MRRQSTAFSGQLRFCSNPFRKSFVVKAGMLFAVLAASFNNLYANEYENNAALPEALAVTTAVQENPNLAQMQARYEALSEVSSQVGSLPDPMVSFSAMNFPSDTFDRDQEAMTQLQIGITQVFPFPGKLSLKETAAEYDALAAGHSLANAKLQLISNVKSKWWQIYYLDHALETVSMNQNLLRQFVTVARTKYETGKGLQQDVLLAQLELSKLIDRKIQLQAIRKNQVIQLNILMGRAVNKAVVLPNKVADALPVLADEAVLHQRSEASGPRLKQVATQIDAAQSRFDLANRGNYPDFKVGVTYGDRTGDNPMPRGGARSDLVSVMVGVTIPLYSGRNQSKAISQKSHELQSTRYALLDERNRLMADISTAITNYQRAKEQYSLLGDGIVPQARQTVQSMLAGYQVGEVDFLNLVRSQMTLFTYQLQYWKALSDAKQALAVLEAAVGEGSIYE